jgi:hypothetical protein
MTDRMAGRGNDRESADPLSRPVRTIHVRTIDVHERRDHSAQSRTARESVDVRDFRLRRPERRARRAGEHLRVADMVDVRVR